MRNRRPSLTRIHTDKVLDMRKLSYAATILLISSAAASAIEPGAHLGVSSPFAGDCVSLNLTTGLGTLAICGRLQRKEHNFIN
jgi:hypothetical protein